ncbi:hypothetical protein AVEN_52395-1 [Araneus ventricosus]|uniref:Uncharacterized protein n=1 Tax=Araneus ventricosus TaxID=182803 RepID=A0A4Y2D101_ARAVE|nr:hypothetical protein AVEN_52395-1 [Araneus ventricosus]
MGQLYFLLNRCPDITFGEYRDEGIATCAFLVLQKHQFCFLTKPSRLKYSSSENYMFPKSISTKVDSLQHSVREIIASINVIHFQGLACLDLVWEHMKVLHIVQCVSILRSQSSMECKTVNGCPGLLSHNLLYGIIIRLCKGTAWQADIYNTAIIDIPRSFEFFEQSLYRIV